MKIKKLILMFTIFNLSSFAFAGDTPATTNVNDLFPFAAQSHNSNGEFDSQWGANIYGTRNNTVDFKRHDNLNGLCDNLTCKINNTLTPSFKLESFDDGKKTEKTAYYLPKPSNISTNGYSIICDYNNNKNAIFVASSYKEIIVTNECTLAAGSQDVAINEVISVTGDGTLYLKPGNYWLDTLELAGSGKIKAQPNQAGSINLYIKNQANLKSSTALGTMANPVNIIYDGGLQINNTEITGMVRAKKISLQGGSAKLNLTAGEYWFENINMNGSAQLTLHDSAFTILHIKDQVEAQGGDTIVNKKGMPLLIYIYNNNNASLHLEGSAKLHGHVYTKGGVELNEGHIDGAVNVHSLFMKGGSITYKPLNGIPETKLDHYRLHFNTNTDNVTAYACGDGTCSPSTLYTGEVKKLHIHADNPNFHNFDKFYGSSSITKKWNTSQCTTFTIQNADKNKNGANPWPESKPVLQCFVDGTRVDNCNVCPKAEPVSSYGYVYGSATIPSVSSSSTNEFTVKEGGGNSLAIYDSKLAINNGSKIKLPLEVTFDKADKVDLVLADTDGREFPVSVTFVPKSLGWVAQSAENGCGEGNSNFNYVANSESCKAIGVAGTSVNLVLEARGEGGKKVENYQANLGDHALQINELNANHKSQVVSRFPMNFTSNNDVGTTLSYNAKQVALIKAQVAEHYAPYIEDTTAAGVKVTHGDTLVMGRTVPKYLQVTGIAGKISDGVAYRAKPVEFTLPPQFEVIACAANSNTCKELPSYTGEFAKGLTLEDSLYFSVDNDLGNQLKISNESADVNLNKTVEGKKTVGTHSITPSNSFKFLFDKVDKKSAESILQELKLDISIESDAVKPNQPLKGTGKAKLDENAELRFGYLLLKDTETSHSQDGVMETELRYFDKNGNSESDSDTEYNLTSPPLTATIVTESGSDANKPPTLTVEEDHIKVSPQADKQWKGKVTLKVENASKADEFIWLKPASDDGTELTDPKADLTLSGRKRGNDKVFNRREVIR